jgi:uncharacterized protein (DUF1778 family)
MRQHFNDAILIRCSESFRRAVAAAAASKDQSMSEFLRQAALREARLTARDTSGEEAA